jgi:hypothetical protein
MRRVDIMLSADAARMGAKATSQLDRLLWILQSKELLTVAERNWIADGSP